MVLPFASRTYKSRSSPVRVAWMRTVTTKSLGGGTMVSVKWSQVASAFLQVRGLEAVNVLPNQLAVGDSGLMVAPGGLAANAGAAASSSARNGVPAAGEVGRLMDGPPVRTGSPTRGPRMTQSKRRGRRTGTRDATSGVRRGILSRGGGLSAPTGDESADLAEGGRELAWPRVGVHFM